jgi:PAS domain S-box-containing protein
MPDETPVPETIYRDLFEFSPTPTALFDEGGRGRLANRAFFLQLGYDPALLAPQALAFHELFDLEGAGAEFLEQVRGRGVVRRREMRLVTAEGDRFTALLSGRKLAIQDEEWLEISFVNTARAEQLARTLRREYTRMASLIENLAAGVFLVDRQGNLTEANAALGNLLGLDPDEFIAESYIKLFAHLIAIAAEPEVLQHGLHRAVLNVNETPVVEFTLDDGEVRHLDLTVFPVRDDDGQPLGWGGLLQDLTALREGAAWKLELLSMLSHDIRSPLATLKGHATALLTSHTHWSPDMVTEFLEAIARGVDRLTHQVDRNLALTRVETGRLGLRPEMADPARLCRQALERAAGVLEDHRIDLEIGDPLPQVRADPGRVEETLVNLLENAARYAPPDLPITIQVAAEGDWIRFTVQDRGPGVPPEKQAAIFEKYVRGEPGGPDAETGGTGLGLYISRMIVEAHGGKLWVRSPLEDGVPGAAFTFTLPVIPAVPEGRPREKRERPNDLQVDEARYRVLVVEDETDYQALLHTTLAEEGYQVEIAPDGGTALEIVRTSPPDIVLLDWVLPNTTGLQVCRSIRRWSHVPVIMVTSRTAQEDIIAAFDVGVDDYIVKPYPREELLARIRALLRRGETWAVEEKTDRFTADGLTIDFDQGEVYVRGRRIELTATELALLTYMARRPRRVLTYRQLLDELWPEGDGTRHALSVHVSRLRAKIEPDPGEPRFIGTRWGIGYVFNPQT